MSSLLRNIISFQLDISALYMAKAWGKTKADVMKRLQMEETASAEMAARGRAASPPSKEGISAFSRINASDFLPLLSKSSRWKAYPFSPSPCSHLQGVTSPRSASPLPSPGVIFHIPVMKTPFGNAPSAKFHWRPSIRRILPRIRLDGRVATGASSDTEGGVGEKLFDLNEREPEGTLAHSGRAG